LKARDLADALLDLSTVARTIIEQDRARIEGLLNESSVDYSESQRRLAKHRMDGVRCRESAYGV
jgi:hypothetical protein